MKNSIIRILSASAAIVFSIMPYAEAAAVRIENSFVIDTDRMSMPKSSDISFDFPDFKRLIGDDTEQLSNLSPVAGYGAITEKSTLYSELPESYSLCDEGLISSVKNQGKYGTCWTFSSAASAESGLINSIPQIDISEWHTAYYPYTGGDQIDIDAGNLEDHMQNGGTIYVVTNLWAQWKGPVSEEKAQYGNIRLYEDPEKTAKLADDADYHLENAYMFDIEKDGSNREAVNNLVKEFVYSGKAVDISFSTKGYDYGTTACYSTEKQKNANHSVVIAGWDDNYTAQNFDGNKGAWLCRNSWDINFGDNGYFWISYDDTSLCEFAVYDLGENDNFSDIYQHDSFVPTQTMSAFDDDEKNEPSYMANIFTADEDSQLEAISTYINNPDTDYEITIYKNVKDPSVPSSGTAVSVTSGHAELTGYQTFELDKNVVLKKGERFSVVVKLYCEDTPYVIPLETCMMLVDPDSGDMKALGKYITYEKICDYTGKNESFYSENGVEWTDVTSENFEFTEEDKNEMLEQIIAENEDITESEINFYRNLFKDKNLTVVMGNISLKAFANPMNTVDFSHVSGNVALNEEIELSVKDGKEIYYSINGGEEILYTEPISLTEETEISATTDHKNYTTKKYKPAEAEFSALGYRTATAYMGGNWILYADRENSHTYNIEVSGRESQIRFFPVTSADVSLGEENFKKNVYGSVKELDFGMNTFEFTLRDENKLDNVITVNVYRNPVSIDIEDEIIEFDEARITVIAEDGTKLGNGESVSEYQGQTLTAVIDGSEEKIKVPDRAVLPELEVDYYNETLNFLPNEIAENAVYAIGTDPKEKDFRSVLGRCIDGQNITSGMIMNKALRIIPGETITLKILAGSGKFGSESVTFTFPDTPKKTSVKPDYTAVNGVFMLNYDGFTEYGFIRESLTNREFDAEAKKFGYTAREFEELMCEKYGLDDKNDILKAMAIEWDAYNQTKAGDDGKAEIAVRASSDHDSFASQIYFAQLIDNSQPTSNPPIKDEILYGDVNGDGNIDALDASSVLTHYALKSTGNKSKLTDKQVAAADFNTDGAVDALDASAILTYYAKKATENFN